MPADDPRDECCICCTPLYEAPLGVLLDAHGRRVCPHYFHDACARRVTPIITRGYGMVMEVEDAPPASAAACPLCRAAFHSVQRLPHPRSDMREWGRLVASNDRAQPTQQDLETVLRATSPLSHTHLACVAAAAAATGNLRETARAVARQMHEGDAGARPDEDGGNRRERGRRRREKRHARGPDDDRRRRRRHDHATADADEVVEVLDGVYQRNERTRRDDHAAAPPPSSAPDIADDKCAWFDHWDAHGRGALGIDVLTDALMDSLARRGRTDVRRTTLRHTLAALWGAFVGGDPRGTTMTREVFVARDGFGDAVVAHLAAAADRAAGRAMVDPNTTGSTGMPVPPPPPPPLPAPIHDDGDDGTHARDAGAGPPSAAPAPSLNPRTACGSIVRVVKALRAAARAHAVLLWRADRAAAAQASFHDVVAVPSA